MLLLTYPMVEKVHLELKKPWAPVKLPLKTVSVEIERGWHRHMWQWDPIWATGKPQSGLLSGN